MITIPIWLLTICILIFPVWALFDRIWTTFDNWLKEITMQKQEKNKIGFNK